jgi:drug/metabolite transporter (DMT)-like permease
MSRASATLIGFTAILLWATLALATSATGAVPPFLLTALTFAIGGGVGLVAGWARGIRLSVFRQPWPVWLHGVGGLFGYHAFYFSALKLAPPAEAGLIAYLWPLFIVLLSAFLPGERLRPAHIAGALMGLAGTIVLLSTKAGGFGFMPTAKYFAGYIAALVCAIVWSGYSVASRWFAGVPTDVVAGFCLVTAALSAICHALFEPSIWPAGAQWVAVVALGVGPVGMAFYTWDIGMKRGDIRQLGVASYAAPVLSTLLLVLGGFATASWPLGIACLLIVGGAAVATLLARQQEGKPT